MNKEVKKGFIEVNLGGEGISEGATEISIEALTYKSKQTAFAVKGKIGKIIQMPIKNLREIRR
jgi:hypothetical protein